MPPSISITSPQPSARHALIFFIPGNPGLINFYTPFLTLLSSLINPSTPAPDTITYDIYGQDLLGFTDDSHAPFSDTNPPFDLEAQIQHVQKTVEEKGRGYDHVVVMGHSVGAYIAVETFSRRLKVWKAGKATNVEIQNGVLLFPTLMHIARSPSGRKLVGLSNVSFFADKAHVLANSLLWLVPMVTLQWVLSTIMGFTPFAAEVTATWLKSRDGIQQALHLGLDEMQTIRENSWEDETWDMATIDGGKGPRFYLYYAEEDHWVDGEGRDEFLGDVEGRVKVWVEGEGVKHAFCTKECKFFSFSLLTGRFVS